MRNQNKILIIDDEEVVRESCIEILREDYNFIETASNGQTGLKKIEEFKPDLIFVDLKMPGLSGLEILERITQIDPTIVSVVITGYATVSSAVEAMKKGAYDFLPKPFTPDEFRLITQRALEKRKLVLETIALRREKEIFRENFITIVSHELKAPLNAIQQNLIVLLGGLLGNLEFEQRFKLERMKLRIDSLLRLIHTWLKISSMDIRQIRGKFQPLEIHPLIDKAVENVQSFAESKKIEISKEISKPISMIYGEEGTLLEALTNVIDNAIKYSPSKGDVLINAIEENTNILISVSDTGIGISKNDLPFLFDDFFRAQADQNKEEGCGLGLAITKRIIEAHFGTIQVMSEPGEGSTFTISLPVYKKEEVKTFLNNNCNVMDSK